MADPINTGFDTEFSDPLTKFRAALDAQGIKTNIISGVRDSAKQAQLYYNYIHGIGGQGLAAPPGTSLHERGLAADIQPANPADLPKMVALAKQYGIVAPYGARDPYHFQLANYQQAEATQAPNTPWGSLADQPTQYASNVADASTPNAGGGFVVPGTNLTSNPFYNSLTGIESGGKNIFSTVDKDYPGQPGSRSQGYAQIDTPTWGQFGRQAGVNLSQYPNAMSAPPNVQAQVASQIPLSRFGSRTRNMLAQQYGQLDASKTIGQLASQFGGAAAAPSPSIPGQTGVVDPSIAARASTTPAAAAPMTAGDWIKKATAPGADGKASPLSAGIGTLAKAIGGGDDQAQQGQQQAQQAEAQQLQAQQAAAAYGAQRQQSLAANASQMMAKVLAAGRKPLSWSSAPPGGGAMPGAGAGQLPPMPQAPSMPDEMLAQLGTSLNSMGDYNG